MIISPPFLPVAGLRSSDQTETDPMMAAVEPFELTHHGVYPIAFDRRWHCGIHLAPSEQTEPVRAIADGDVIAYRVSKNAMTDGLIDPQTGQPVLNCNTGFVLLKHTTDTGDGRTITFYSLYMHLLDMTNQQQIAHQPTDPPENSSPTALPAWLLDTAGGKNGTVQTGGDRKVYRKDMLGYWGGCHGMPHLHVEIFMTEADFTAWFEQAGQTVQLGEKNPVQPASADYWGHSYFVIPGGLAFVSVPPGQGDSPYFPKLPGGTLEANCTLYVEAYFHKGERYTRSWIDRGDGAITLLTASPVKDPYKEYEYNLYQRATKHYPDCPSDGYELMRFGRILSDHPTLPDAKRATYVAVPFDANGTLGYVDVNRSAVQKLSDADFPFFTGWQKIDDVNTPFDQAGLCSYDELRKLVGDDAAPPYLAQPIDPAFTVRDDLAAYVQDNDAVRARLKGFVCHAPSEWDPANNDQRYKGLNEPDGFFGSRADTDPDGYSKFQGFLKQFQFLDQTSLGGGQKFWFFHPLAFIRHFRKCGWLSEDELSKIYDDQKYASVGKTGSEYKERYRYEINRVMRKYTLNTLVRSSHFFGQCAIESFYMMVVRESAIGIATAIKTNNTSITPEINGYLRSPPAAPADVAYFSKYEGVTRLGNTEAGDGVKFRGRGFKQLTGKYNYAAYWLFRGWLNRAGYDHSWFKADRHGHTRPGPEIEHPEMVGNDSFSCVDTAGFFFTSNRIAKVADAGITKAASLAVTKIVNAYDTKSPPLRWHETHEANKILGDIS